MRMYEKEGWKVKKCCGVDTMLRNVEVELLSKIRHSDMVRNERDDLALKERLSDSDDEIRCKVEVICTLIVGEKFRH